MRAFRTIARGIALVAALYAANTIGAAVLAACEQRILPALQVPAAAAFTVAAGCLAYAIERRRRAHGLRAWSWYAYAVGAGALGTFGAALHAYAVRDAAHVLFDAMFFAIAAPAFGRRWDGVRRFFRRERFTF